MVILPPKMNTNQPPFCDKGRGHSHFENMISDQFQFSLYRTARG